MIDNHDDAGVAVCGNSDCRVAENGRCVEGFELDACPHYLGETLAGSEGGVVADSQEDEVGVESVQLADADALSALAGIRDIARWQGAGDCDPWAPSPPERRALLPVSTTYFKRDQSRESTFRDHVLSTHSNALATMPARRRAGTNHMCTAHIVGRSVSIILK